MLAEMSIPDYIQCTQKVSILRQRVNTVKQWFFKIVNKILDEVLQKKKNFKHFVFNLMCFFVIICEAISEWK